jgi:ribonuclease P protein component
VKFTESLKKNYEFRRVYARGKSAATSLLVLYCLRNRAGKNRLGITVGGKVGKAVVRNRIRRRVKEIYRLGETRFKPGWDIVAVARGRAAGADYRELETDLFRAAARLSLLMGQAK